MSLAFEQRTKQVQLNSQLNNHSAIIIYLLKSTKHLQKMSHSIMGAG